MRQICMEIESDLSLNYDKGMVLNVQSADKSVRFFGAAAMAVREIEYMTATWPWLRSQNIGGDVGPGSMPPSRAQIKRYNALNGIEPQSINANMDNSELIIEFLEQAGISHSVAGDFVDDLLFARKLSPSGATHSLINSLLSKHNLSDIIEIQGHGHLSVKASAVIAKSKAPALLSWLQPVRETQDASLAVSDATAISQEDDSLLTLNAEATTIKTIA